MLGSFVIAVVIPMEPTNGEKEVCGRGKENAMAENSGNGKDKREKEKTCSFLRGTFALQQDRAHMHTRTNERAKRNETTSWLDSLANLRFEKNLRSL